MPEITKSSIPKTQREAVIWHLKYAGTLTSTQASDQYGITRLAEYIRSLRQEIINTPGSTWNIESIEMRAVNRFGRSFSYAKYKLHM